MKNSARGARVTVPADGRGLVSQAGSVLLWENDAGHRPGAGPVAEPGPVAGAAPEFAATVTRLHALPYG